ncbi:hypothetical protein HYQ46_008159 [Verticillium longisporum]|nr:hypothetical protein HYQ46_008159 [Verticillium longisporum]
MTPNSRVYGMKHESSRRDVLSSSNVPGDSAAEAKANNERQTCKMEWVRGHLDMSDEEVDRNAEKRAVRSGEKKLMHEATISNRALAAAHSDHANRGSHTLFPPITDDTMPAEETPHPRVNKASNHLQAATRSSCQTSWDAMTIQEKLRFLDAFFDNDAPIGSHLPPLVKEQQILYDKVFAKALAVPSEYAETPHLKAERDAARAKNKAAGDRISSAYHDSMRRLLSDDHQVAFPQQPRSFCPIDSRKEATETLGVSRGGPKTAVDTTRMNSETWRDQSRGNEPRPETGTGSEPRRHLEGVPPCPTRRAPVVPREGGRRFRRALTEPLNPPTAYDWSLSQGLV